MRVSIFLFCILLSTTGYSQRNRNSVNFWGPGLAAIFMMDWALRNSQSTTIDKLAWSQEELNELRDSARRQEIQKLTPFQRQFLTSQGKSTCVPYQDKGNSCFYVGNKSSVTGAGAITATCHDTVEERAKAQEKYCDRILVDGLTTWNVQ